MTGPLSEPAEPDWKQKLWINLAGLAADYWKDGGTEQSLSKPASEPDRLVTQTESKESLGTGWQKDRVHILETLWGKGHVLPGGTDFIDMLTLPLGTNKEISALDLSAGLGAMGHRLAVKLETYVTGLEPDAELAEAGQKLMQEEHPDRRATVEAYDPETYEVTKRYDCILARALFYRIKDKPRFFEAIKNSLKEEPKPYGQMVFTDYICEAGNRKNPEVQAWLKAEPEASPQSLPETVLAWRKLGFDVRVKEDLTEMYVHEIKTALMAFIAFLADHPPAHETKLVILKEIERWAYRAAALEGGLQFYRFYAIR